MKNWRKNNVKLYSLKSHTFSLTVLKTPPSATINILNQIITSLPNPSDSQLKDLESCYFTCVMENGNFDVFTKNYNKDGLKMVSI